MKEMTWQEMFKLFDKYFSEADPDQDENKMNDEIGAGYFYGFLGCGVAMILLIVFIILSLQFFLGG